ncbi:sensor histidine kinase [Qaidamihabitans albus]|uniref:sensor histidine kinase n=1 Tax=Qaidamihabitans albus TaxID=2795733 RepID=UPI0018F1725C|nr:histidine kinase [Qaidamihabitans albus]
MESVPTVPPIITSFRRLPPVRQDMLIATGHLAVGSGLYAGDLYAIFGVDRAPVPARFALLAVVCALLTLRRRAPGAALGLALVPLGADAALGLSVPVLLVCSDHLYTATLYGSRRLSRAIVTVVAMGTLAVTATLLMLAPDWRMAVGAAFLCVPFAVTPVWWATNIRQHKEIAEAERANATQMARLAELDRGAAVAAERTRMARDLHDVIAGHLSAIALQSEAALSATDPGTVRTVLTAVRENSVGALEEMRAMIGLLRADGPAEITAPARLNELPRLVESARASGIRLDVHTELDGAPLPAAVDLTAYRIAQEALTNTAKHAPGTVATVTIRHTGDALTVEVTNELTGEPDGAAGTGLLSMRERAAAVGGSCSAGPSGADWRVRAVLPLAGLGS